MDRRVGIQRQSRQKLGNQQKYTTDRTGMFEGYRILKREHEQMKATLAALVVRVKRLEGTDSPTDSPPE